MTKFVSVDLRQRVVNAYLRGDGSYDELAARFEIGRASLNRWLRRFKETGSVEPNAHAGGREPRVGDHELSALRAFVAEQPDRTVQEITLAWSRQKNVSIGRSSMLRALHRAGLSFKKSPSERRRRSAKMSSLGAPASKKR